MTITLSCHCGGTRIELPEAPIEATQCTCSYCTKSGGLWAYYEIDAPRVIADGNDRIYSPTSPLHAHHFCAKCGCTTYGTSPDYSLEDTTIPEKRKFAVNVKLLDNYELYRALPVSEIDGRNLW
jgi:hypothetical protein